MKKHITTLVTTKVMFLLDIFYYIQYIRCLSHVEIHVEFVQWALTKKGGNKNFKKMMHPACVNGTNRKMENPCKKINFKKVVFVCVLLVCIC